MAHSLGQGARTFSSPQNWMWEPWGLSRSQEQAEPVSVLPRIRCGTESGEEWRQRQSGEDVGVWILSYSGGRERKQAAEAFLLGDAVGSCGL